MRYLTLITALVLISCDKDSTRYDGYYQGFVSFNWTLDMYYPAAGTSNGTTANYPISATITAEEGKYYLGMPQLCEFVELKNGSGHINCSTTSQDDPGSLVITSWSGEVESNGTSLQLDLTSIIETKLDGILLSRTTQKYTGTIPKM